jgi:tRNA (guanine37-N1)-methyltransferase
MRAPALVVPREHAEAARRDLRRAGTLRSDLRVLRSDHEVVFPLASAPTTLPAYARVEEREFEVLDSERPASYRDLVDLPDDLRTLLPRAFDVVGDIALIRLPEELAPHAEVVGRALLEFVPGARIVGWDRGVRGVERRRELVRLAGTGSWAARHRENGLEFEVDLERAYFSPRLAGEHARVASAVHPGETVFDLCCGIGPFALTIARDGRAGRVVAVDSNPDAIELLRRNARRMGLFARVDARAESLESFLPSGGISSRAILNLPLEGIKYAPSVAATVERGGTLHYYEITDRASRATRPGELARALSRAGAPWRAAEAREVHPYSPRSDLVAYTFRRV